MTWIKTVPVSDAGFGLLSAMEDTMRLYPPEYAVPVESLMDHVDGESAAIVMAHSLLPDALRHAFSTYGVLLNPELPLSRRDHELIAATVSSINDCFY